MIITEKIVGVLRHEVGNNMFNKIIEVYPEGMRSNSFCCLLPQSDSRLHIVKDLLTEAGFKPRDDRFKELGTGEYLVELDRQYDDSDLSKASYLELKPHDYLFDRDVSGHKIYDVPAYRHGPGESGQIQIERRFLRESVYIAYTHIGAIWIVIPDHVKVLLAASGLRGVAFRPTVPIEGSGSRKRVLEWKEHSDPWWELISDITLPPVSPTMDIRDNKGQPITNRTSSVFGFRVEGLFAHPELHYRAGDIASAEPFDLAFTFEALTGGGMFHPENRSLVASQRFRQFCIKHDLNINWIPVRIDSI